MPSAQMIDTLRRDLEEERDQLRVQVDGAEPRAAGDDENFADLASVAARQGESRALTNALGDQLLEVERALVKLDEGNYGTCEVCGREIAEARLEAMPATRFCIDHASG